MQYVKTSIILAFILSGTHICYAIPLAGNKISMTLKHQYVGFKSYVEVEVSFPSNDGGQRLLDIPSKWTDAHGLKNNFYDLSDNIYFLEDKWIAKTESSQDIKIRYKIKGDKAHWFSPKINKDFFALIGHTALILPVFEDDEIINLELQWNNTEKEFHIANSYGANTKKQALQTTYGDIKRALFLGGKIRIMNIEQNGSHFYLAFYPSESEDANEITSIALSILKSHSSYMSEIKPKYFLSAWIRLPSESHEDYSGTLLENSQIIFEKAEKKMTLSKVKEIISHEYFHYWLGAVVKKGDSTNTNWFFEGFTDYMGMNISVSNGIISLEDYLTLFNTYLKYQYTRPEFSENYENVAQKYWESPEYFPIPYIKGHLFASEMDYIIQNISKGRFKLKDAIIKLASAGDISNEELLKTLDYYSGGKASILWDDYFIHGKLIRPTDKVFGRKIKIEESKNYPQVDLIAPTFFGPNVYNDVGQYIGQSIFGATHPNIGGQTVYKAEDFNLSYIAPLPEFG